MVREKVMITLTSADLLRSVSRLTSAGIELFDLTYIDDFTAKMWIWRNNFQSFLMETRQKGDRVTVLRVSGLLNLLKGVRRRSILLIFTFALLLLTVWIPGRVLFISVEGNETVATEEILQQTEICGLYFGAERSALRSERIKNMLMDKLPALAWVGVNTNGCTAVIQVREKNLSINRENKYNSSSIIASHDGIITDCIVLSGKAICKIGDAVKKDQVLISGYQDLGIIVKLTQSRGEVFARTQREIHLRSPVLTCKKETSAAQTVLRGITIGKKRINLSNCSGISYRGCDKIYKEYSIVLPGGYVLPLRFTFEYIFRCEGTAEVLAIDKVRLLDYADHYLLEQMVSGRILVKNYTSENDLSIYDYRIIYECIEMIGRERSEAYKFDYGKND